MNHVTSRRRILPVGAELQEDGAHFRVWAPKARRVAVEIEGERHDLDEEPNGYFGGFVRGACAGTRYCFRLDGGDPLPDPASRYQPDGPHGASEVVDPRAFRWTDDAWRGPTPEGHVAYEMHVGTFTREGTFASAAEQLGELAQLGVTVVEMMPIAEFPGRFGWGYDGVDLFAPYHHYGTPEDLRAFVDRAHAEGLAVILDVVYNHVGPDGNYLPRFTDTYFSRKHTTDWGDAVNFDDAGCHGVRDFVLANARHWIAEYHLDGLRLDATQDIHDESDTHILREIGLAARAAAGDRAVLMVAESEPQDARIIRPIGGGGFGLDQIWCDDFHHSAHVAASGRREAYFTDYRGAPQELVSLAKYGILYQGQRYDWQDQRRGSPAWDIAPHQCMVYLENHDQVANSRDGRRLHQKTSPGRYRALTALLLLSRQTPLLFQGQEYGASAPFLFFADHNRDLSALVRRGRAEFLRQFPSLATRDAQRSLDDPGDPATFARSHLDSTEREHNVEHVALHRDLIALRRCDPVIAGGTARLDGAVLGEAAFVLRYFGVEGEDRLLLVNLGADVALDVAPEPLLAPVVREEGWTRLWYSEDPRYGGQGAPPVEAEDGSWRLPAESATLLVSGAR